jgi:hypothetical protein
LDGNAPLDEGGFWKRVKEWGTNDLDGSYSVRLWNYFQNARSEGDKKKMAKAGGIAVGALVAIGLLGYCAGHLGTNLWTWYKTKDAPAAVQREPRVLKQKKAEPVEYVTNLRALGVGTLHDAVKKVYGINRSDFKTEAEYNKAVAEAGNGVIKLTMQRYNEQDVVARKNFGRDSVTLINCVDGYHVIFKSDGQKGDDLRPDEKLYFAGVAPDKSGELDEVAKDPPKPPGKGVRTGSCAEQACEGSGAPDGTPDVSTTYTAGNAKPSASAGHGSCAVPVSLYTPAAVAPEYASAGPIPGSGNTGVYSSGSDTTETPVSAGRFDWSNYNTAEFQEALSNEYDRVNLASAGKLSVSEIYKEALKGLGAITESDWNSASRGLSKAA